MKREGFNSVAPALCQLIEQMLLEIRQDFLHFFQNLAGFPISQGLGLRKRLPCLLPICAELILIMEYNGFTSPRRKAADILARSTSSIWYVSQPLYPLPPLWQWVFLIACHSLTRMKTTTLTLLELSGDAATTI